MMATARHIRDADRPLIGIEVELPTVSPLWNKEIQRAEDDGTGSPTGGTEVIVATVDAQRTRFVDLGKVEILERSKGYIYRYRLTREGAADGTWSDWSAAQKPTLLTGRLEPATDARGLLLGLAGAGAISDTVADRLRKVTGGGNLGLSILLNGFSILYHPDEDDVQDQDTVTFSQNFDSVPAVTFSPKEGLFFRTGDSSSDQRARVKASGLTKSGFDMVAEQIVGSSSSTTAITDGFSGSQNASAPENGDVTLTAEGATAFSNLEDANATETTYNAFFDVDGTGMSGFNTVTVHLEHNSSTGGTSWTEVGSRLYDNSANVTDQKLSASLTLDADYDLRLRITYTDTSDQNASVVAHGEDNTQPGVEYDKVTSTPTTKSMTPASSDAIAYEAKDAG